MPFGGMPGMRGGTQFWGGVPPRGGAGGLGHVQQQQMPFQPQYNIPRPQPQYQGNPQGAQGAPGSMASGDYAPNGYRQTRLPSPRDNPVEFQQKQEQERQQQPTPEPEESRPSTIQSISTPHNGTPSDSVPEKSKSGGGLRNWVTEPADHPTVGTNDPDAASNQGVFKYIPKTDARPTADTDWYKSVTRTPEQVNADMGTKPMGPKTPSDAVAGALGVAGGIVPQPQQPATPATPSDEVHI